MKNQSFGFLALFACLGAVANGADHATVPGHLVPVAMLPSLHRLVADDDFEHELEI